MTGEFTFVPDEHGIFELTSGEEIAPLLDQAARNAADRMRTLSAQMHRSSYFAFRASIVTRAARRGPDRVFVAYAGSTSPGWHLQEFGTSRQPPRAILRRGIAQSGITFREHGR